MQPFTNVRTNQKYSVDISDIKDGITRMAVTLCCQSEHQQCKKTAS